MTGNGIAIIFGLLALSIGPSISRQGKYTQIYLVFPDHHNHIFFLPVKNSKVDLPTIHIHPIEVEGKTFYMGTFFKVRLHFKNFLAYIYLLNTAFRLTGSKPANFAKFTGWNSQV